MDALHHALVPIARAMAFQQLDLQVVERVEIRETDCGSSAPTTDCRRARCPDRRWTTIWRWSFPIRGGCAGRWPRAGPYPPQAWRIATRSRYCSWPAPYPCWKSSPGRTATRDTSPAAVASRSRDEPSATRRPRSRTHTSPAASAGIAPSRTPRGWRAGPRCVVSWCARRGGFRC